MMKPMSYPPDCSRFFLAVVVVLLEITLDRRRSQKLLDPFCLGESFVDQKAKVRSKFQVNAMRDLAAQIAFVAVKCGHHGFLIASAERHHVDGGKAQVRAHAHFRNSDEMTF